MTFVFSGLSYKCTHCIKDWLSYVEVENMFAALYALICMYSLRYSHNVMSRVKNRGRKKR